MVVRSSCLQPLRKWVPRTAEARVWTASARHRREKRVGMIRLSLLALVITAAAGLARADSLDGALAARDRGDPDESIRLSSEAIAAGDLSQGRRAYAYYNRGSSYYLKGEFDKAITDYDEAIRLRPDFVNAYYARGLAHGRKNQPDQAIADYDAAIRLKPDYAEAHYDRGFVYAYLGQYKIAIADFDRAILLQPDFVLAYASRGDAYRGIGLYDKAIVDYDVATVLSPDFVRAYFGRAIAYVRKGQY